MPNGHNAAGSADEGDLQPSAAAETPVNILIVDDEPKNLTVLETVLDVPGYRLVRAGSANEALLALVAEDFAVLVLDIRMPGMSGLELAQVIKGRRKTAQIPIIFLTAYYNEDQHVLEGYETGAVDYLHKPVNAQILRSKVATFAKLYRANRELVNANRLLVGEVAERRRAEAELIALNDNLDRLVAERTEALRKLEQDLRVADRRKDEFIATLAHELRNPLAPIRNALQILQRDPAATAAARGLRDLMAQQVEVLARLLEDLLDVSRISQGRIELRRERVALADVLKAAIDASRPQIEAGHHRLDAPPVDDDIVLFADRTRLMQVFVNLLGNAAKYTEDGGHIRLEVKRVDDEVEVGVADDGIGIPPERLGDVFTMFSQVPDAAGRSRGGLGIGLALVRYLVELHGGHAAVQSEGAGRGSRFTVRLPVAPAAVEVAPTPPAADAPPADAGRRRILVVDDNRAAADTLSELLTLVGHEVRTVYDGETALAEATQVRPDVVLLDLGLPGVDGYEVCERLRQQDWGDRVTVIALTGWGDQDSKRKGHSAGFDLHLVKPVDEDSLLDAIAYDRAAGSPGAVHLPA